MLPKLREYKISSLIELAFGNNSSKAIARERKQHFWIHKGCICQDPLNIPIVMQTKRLNGNSNSRFLDYLHLVISTKTLIACVFQTFYWFWKLNYTRRTFCMVFACQRIQNYFSFIGSASINISQPDVLHGLPVPIIQKLSESSTKYKLSCDVCVQDYHRRVLPLILDSLHNCLLNYDCSLCGCSMAIEWFIQYDNMISCKETYQLLQTCILVELHSIERVRTLIRVKR